MTDYASVLESYIIDDIDIEIANEGVNRQTVKSVKNSQQYKDLTDAMKTAKKLERAYRKTKDITNLENALKVYKSFNSKIDALKKFIDSQPELDGFIERVCAALTPSLFRWKFPPEELTNFVYISYGNTTYTSYNKNIYTDSLSRGTNSALKRKYQQGMNLFKVNTEKKIKALARRIEKIKIKNAKKAARNGDDIQVMNRKVRNIKFG